MSKELRKRAKVKKLLRKYNLYRTFIMNDFIVASVNIAVNYDSGVTDIMIETCLVVLENTPVFVL